MTQPDSYSTISSDREPKVLKKALEDFSQNGNDEIKKYCDEISTNYTNELNMALQKSKSDKPMQKNWDVMIDSKLSVPKSVELIDIDKNKILKYLNEPLVAMQKQNFTPHKAVRRSFVNRLNTVTKEGKIDWSTAEFLAYCTMLESGVDIRLSGQDVKRGTFTHRHHVLFNQKEPYQEVSVFENITGIF